MFPHRLLMNIDSIIHRIVDIVILISLRELIINFLHTVMLFGIEIVNDIKQQFLTFFTSLLHLHLVTNLVADKVDGDLVNWECSSTVNDCQHIEEQINHNLITAIIIVIRHLIIRTNLRDNAFVTITTSNLLTNIQMDNTLHSDLDKDIGEHRILILPALVIIQEFNSSLVDVVDLLRIISTRFEDLFTCFLDLLIVNLLAIQVFQNLMIERSVFHLRII